MLPSQDAISGVTPTVMLGYSHGAYNWIEQDVEIGGMSSAAGDFNGDGNLDIVMDGGNILLGSGDGAFTQGPVLNAGTVVTVADFNKRRQTRRCGL